METSNNCPEEEPREEQDAPVLDIWSDEGARLFNQMLDEGSAYLSVNTLVFGDPEMEFYDQQSEYRDPEFFDPDEETLAPGDMELIFENSYIL